MRNRRTAALASLAWLACASFGCYDAGGDSGSHEGAIADHPYGELFEASPETMASCEPQAAGCTGGPNLFSPEGGGGGYACDDSFYEILVVNCGDAPTDRSFTVAHFEGGRVDEARNMGESEAVSPGLLPGWAVWVDFTIPADAWPQVESQGEDPRFDRLQMVDPDDGVEECDEDDNGLEIGGMKENCAFR